MRSFTRLPFSCHRVPVLSCTRKCVRRSQKWNKVCDLRPLLIRKALGRRFRNINIPIADDHGMWKSHLIISATIQSSVFNITARTKLIGLTIRLLVLVAAATPAPMAANQQFRMWTKHHDAQTILAQDDRGLLNAFNVNI